MKKVPKRNGVIAVVLAILAGAGALWFVNSGKPVAPVAPVAPPVAPITFVPVQHLLRAQPKLPTINIWIGNDPMVAEICRAPVEIATGMMFRTKMAENEAMLFVFANPEPRNFYMRNCLVPLSAAYIGPDGRISEVVDLHPGDERGVQSRSVNIQFVLETPQGWFTRHGITNGTVVRTERGSLMETFFPK